jgi:hypothetical protein
MAADAGLREGSYGLYRDRAQAKSAIQEAINRYDEVLGGTEEEALRQRASFNLGRARECLGDVKAAESQYQNVANQWPDTPFGIAAAKRVKDLKRPETREFYDWFARQETRATPGPGAPGARAPYHLDTLPDTGGSSEDSVVVPDASTEAGTDADAKAGSLDDLDSPDMKPESGEAPAAGDAKAGDIKAGDAKAGDAKAGAGTAEPK